MAVRGLVRDSGHLLDYPVDRGCRGHDISADYDKSHLHGERDERPEGLAAFYSQLGRTLSYEKTEQKDDDDPGQGKYPCVRKPLFGPLRQGQPKALKTSYLLSSSAITVDGAATLFVVINWFSFQKKLRLRKNVADKCYLCKTD